MWDSAGDVGRNASLAVVNGRPASSYFDFGNYELKYGRQEEPPVSAIPALDQWGMIIFALLVAGVAFALMRKVRVFTLIKWTG